MDGGLSSVGLRTPAIMQLAGERPVEQAAEMTSGQCALLSGVYWSVGLLMSVVIAIGNLNFPQVLMCAGGRGDQNPRCACPLMRC